MNLPFERRMGRRSLLSEGGIRIRIPGLYCRICPAAGAAAKSVLSSSDQKP